MSNRTILIPILLFLLLCACAAPQKARDTTKEATTVTTNPSPQTSAPVSSDFSCDALFFGDSITADSNFEDFFPELRVVNLGVYGDTLEDLLRRVPAVKAERPARIFLLGGINCLRGDNLERCVGQYRDLLDALRNACPKAELCVQSVLPIGAELESPLFCTNETVRAFNDRLRALAAEYGLAYLDLYAVYEKDGALDPTLTRDGVHLNFNAYGPWAALLAPYLSENEE